MRTHCEYAVTGAGAAVNGAVNGAPRLNGAAVNGAAAVAGRRPVDGGCPKCAGCVLVRYDGVVGYESYCVNCGWTPLVQLDRFLSPPEERRRLEALRRAGRRLAFVGGHAES
jgi:hypothetical protein